MPVRDSVRRLFAVGMLVAMAGTSGCKTLSERYIALEVWKYERCFGHLPPGFVPPGAGAQPMRPCGQSAAACAPAAADGCDQCQGGAIEGGLPAGARIVPDLPPGPGGAPTALPAPTMPSPAPVTAGRPVVISDEVVLP